MTTKKLAKTMQEVSDAAYEFHSKGTLSGLGPKEILELQQAGSSLIVDVAHMMQELAWAMNPPEVEGEEATA